MNFRPRNPLPLIVALATMLLAPALAPAHSFDWPTAAPGATAPLRENSQRGAQLPIPASRQADATLSAELHQGCGSAYGAIASESLLAPVSEASAAMRAGVMANISESQAARASSNIDVLFAKEGQLRAGYAMDSWSMTTLPKGSIVYGGIPGQSAFYTDAAAVVGSGGSRATFFQSMQSAAHPVFGYRPAVSMYEVMSDMRVPMGTTLNNPALGPGGATQFFIRNYSQSLRDVGFIPLGK